MVIKPSNHSSHTINNNLSCIQINLARSQKAFHELGTELAKSSHDIVYIQEPYTGKADTAKSIPGYTIYQFSTGRSVKAIIALKDKRFSSLGITKHSDSNLCMCKSALLMVEKFS